MVNEMEERHIVLAGRASLLAKAQNKIVRSKLERMGYDVSELGVTTRGDMDKTTPVTRLGGNGLFVREVEKALLRNEADAAVHCAKDLPYEFAEGLVVAGVVDEADPRDVILIRKDRTQLFEKLAVNSRSSRTIVKDDRPSIQEMPVQVRRPGSDKPSGTGELSGLTHVNETVGGGEEAFVVGTGSPRRVSQLKKIFPGISCAEIRGNINTRIERLRRAEYDAIVLAKAGLDRTGIDVSDLDLRILETDEMVPAVGQGLLAVQCREDDHVLRKLLFDMSDPKAYLRFMVERELFCRFRCGCDAPIGIYARIDEAELKASVSLNVGWHRHDI